MLIKLKNGDYIHHDTVTKLCVKKCSKWINEENKVEPSYFGVYVYQGKDSIVFEFPLQEEAQKYTDELANLVNLYLNYGRTPNYGWGSGVTVTTNPNPFVEPTKY
jgi:hypothetical protein